MKFHPASPDYHASWFNRAAHGPLAAVVPYVAAAATVAQAAGTIMSGNAARGAANFEAAQLTQQAGQEKAVAQRRAMEIRRQGAMVNSTVQARAAASGAGVTDPTVLDLMGDNEATTEYNALNALYQGDENARLSLMGAQARRYEGAQARQASLISAGSGLLKSGSAIMTQNPSLFDKYGQGGPALPRSAFDGGSYGPSTLPWQNTPGYQVPTYG